MSRRDLVGLLAAVAVLSSCVAEAPRAQRWTCAMHPQYVTDRPGDCPICGMKLVPLLERPAHLAEGAADSGAPLVAMDPQRQRLIGLRTVEVASGSLAGAVRATGRVTLDETRVHKVTARFEGYVDKLFADFTGKEVHKGDPLISIYSPELLATEEEYLLARRSEAELARSGLPDVAKSARARLRLYGIGERELERLEQRGTADPALTLYAPISGYVLEKTAVAGAKVGPAEALFVLADLSRVWILAELHEQDLARVRLGQVATVTAAFWPGRSWQGRVRFIYPLVDDKTRTVKVRVEVENPGVALKPEMFVDISIASEARVALLVPEDAVIDSGARKLAFVEVSTGRFLARELRLGLHASGRYEVLAGLRAGERVAAGASFLLDSESSLRSELSARGALGDGGAP